jgi:hypothetical protein
MSAAREQVVGGSAQRAPKATSAGAIHRFAIAPCKLRCIRPATLASSHRPIRQQTGNDDFQLLLFRDRPNDRIMVAHTRRPLMNQHASKKSVPPSVGADVSGIETLLNRNLPEVFGEGDPARRRAAIQELYTEDCVLCVPPGTFVGHDALDKFAGDLRATHPHYVYTPHGAPQVLHNSGRLAWGSGPKGETPQYTGVDFIITRDGKIAALYVYLDSPPT